MIGKADNFQALAGLGLVSFTDTQEMAAIQFVVYLYGRSNCTYLNELFCDKANKNITAKKLPPTENSFHLHLLRCVYHLALWRQCISAMIEIPEQYAYGYEQDPKSQNYLPKLMSHLV